MSRDQNQPLGQDFTAASLLKFAFPTMVTMVFMGLYTIGDTIVFRVLSAQTPCLLSI